MMIGEHLIDYIEHQLLKLLKSWGEAGEARQNSCYVGFWVGITNSWMGKFPMAALGNANEEFADPNFPHLEYLINFENIH